MGVFDDFSPSGGVFADFKPQKQGVFDDFKPQEAGQSSLGSYVSEGMLSLRKGIGDIAQGAKETITEFPERYREAEPPPGVEAGPLGRTITGPLYRAAAATLTSPAAVAAGEMAASTGFTPLRPSLPNLPGKTRAPTEPVQPQVDTPPVPSPQTPPASPPVGSAAPAIDPQSIEDAVRQKFPEASEPHPVLQEAMRQHTELQKLPSEQMKRRGERAATLDFLRKNSAAYRDFEQGKNQEAQRIRAGLPDNLDRLNKFLAEPNKPGKPPSAQPVGAATTGYPEIYAGNPGGARGLIQQRLGLGEREAQQAITALEPYQARFNAMPRADRLKTIDYMENRSHGNSAISPELQPAADVMRSVYKDIEHKWGGLKSAEDMSFVTDYFRHQVKQPNKLPAFMSAWKEGSARGAGKARTFPTVSDLLGAGHELVNDNPVEVTMDYAHHMSRYLAAEEVVDIAREQKVAKFYTPGKAPEGWVPLEGRHGNLTPHGTQLHAPAEFAKDFNAFVSKGFEGTAGDIFQAARAITNVATAAKLIGGYHALTMSASSFTSDLSRMIDNLSYGRPLQAGKSGLRASTIIGSAIGQYRTGKLGQKIYSGKTPGGEWSKVIDYLTQANFHPSQIDKSISVNQMGNLYTAWKRGALSPQLRNMASDIAGAPGALGKAFKAAQGAWNLFGRAIDTAMSPLFNELIPALKTGAAMESLRDWIAANPAADFETIMTEARRVQANMDDRFGEMVHDNIFWAQKTKQALQAAFLSYSWNLGVARALGGGIADVGRAAVGSAEWSRRASYALAFPIGAMYLSGVYQYLKTGGGPTSLTDLLAPRTGGTVPGDRHRQEVPERLLVPGHMKDVFELYQVATGDRSVLDIAANKLNPTLKLLGDIVTGKDWKGDPIADPQAATSDKIKQYLGFMAEGVEPIFMGAMERSKVGTNISPFEQIMGVRTAPDFLQDPTGHGDMMRFLANKAWVDRLKHEESAALKKGDKDKASALAAEIKRRTPPKTHRPPL